MIRRVELTRRAEKQVRRLPARVGKKLSHWVYLVMGGMAWKRLERFLGFMTSRWLGGGAGCEVFG